MNENEKYSLPKTLLFIDFLSNFIVDGLSIVRDDKWKEFLKSFDVLYLNIIKSYCDEFNSLPNQDRHKIYQKVLKYEVNALRLKVVHSDSSKYSKFCYNPISFDIVPDIVDLRKFL